jgi:hypothetical protein
MEPIKTTFDLFFIDTEGLDCFEKAVSIAGRCDGELGKAIQVL